MTSIVVGDTVRLKAGGHVMTVLGPSARGGDYVVAIWYENSAKRGRSFARTDLEHADGDGSDD